MAFKYIKSETANFSTPQEMFQDNKMKNILGLIDYQSKMIDNYMYSIRDDGTVIDKHVAFELPTGSGKTLIGLLIGEFHRRKYHRKVLFLCPTKQLVAQVCYQAKTNYGINVIEFIGKQTEYSPNDRSDYLLGKKIGVTTYSSFFAASEYFKGTDILIFDDVHSSEQYIADNWSINIQKGTNYVLYRELSEIIKETEVGDLFYSRMSADSPYESDIIDWCNMIPMPMIEHKLPEIESIINASCVEDSKMKYSWSRICDHLRECNIFVSWDSILIRPFIVPTRSFAPFENSLHCIYMSATLGKSGELERIIGVDKIKRLPIANEWDKKGVGRRFFVFPDLSFEAEMHNDIIKRFHKLSKKSVVIVPNNRDQEELANYIKSSFPETQIYYSQELINSKEEFKLQEDAMVIMSNRFDGIDFPDDESRMLILHNFPKTTHLQEKFFYSRMAASILYSERIKTRIVQAVGRCTRNAKDYAVVCILGNNILNDLITESSLNEYKSELRAEIKFGIENSTGLSDINEIIENIEAFLSRDDSWADVEEHIVKIRDSYIQQDNDRKDNSLYDKLKESSVKEVKLQYALWRKDYKSAFHIACEIISILDAPKLKGYKAFWQYCAGHIALKVGNNYYTKALELFKDASRNAPNITWLADLAKQKQELSITLDSNVGLFSVIERLEKNIFRYNTSQKLEKKINSILDGLTNAKGEAFETSHKNLGEILGYEASNPKGTGDPDPYWIINDDFCIVSEDKIYEHDDHKIPLEHISQANRHEKWIREKVKTLHNNAKIYTVFITNTSSIEEAGRIHAENLYYCNRSDLISWAHKALKVIRDCYNTFTEEGDSEWRQYVGNELKRNSVTPDDFISMITKTKLSKL